MKIEFRNGSVVQIPDDSNVDKLKGLVDPIFVYFPVYPRGLHPIELEPHYSRHVEAMTAERLHSKSDIAMQLALRDSLIERLDITNAELLKSCKRLLEDIRRYTQIDHAEYMSVCQQAVLAITKAESN